MKSIALLLLLLEATLFFKVTDAFSVKPHTPNAPLRITTTRNPVHVIVSSSSSSKFKVAFPATPLFRPTNRQNTYLTSTSPSEGDSGESDAPDTSAANVGFGKRIGSYFKGSEKDDGLTFRQRLAKMGLATVLSYGWISNTNAMILVAAAWYVFCMKVSKKVGPGNLVYSYQKSIWNARKRLEPNIR